MKFQDSIVFGGLDVFGEFMRKQMRKWTVKRFCIVWELVMVELEITRSMVFRCVLGNGCVEFDCGILLLILVDVSDLY